MSDLADARESLAYWQARAHRLPLHAVRKRREARVLAARWEARVAAAERARYGRGVLGAIVMLCAERRLPVRALRARRSVARAARLAAASAIALCVLAAAATVQLVAAVLHALS